VGGQSPIGWLSTPVQVVATQLTHVVRNSKWRNIMKHKLLFILIIFITACATATPKATNINNSAIALTIGADIHSGLLTVEDIAPGKIFFVRLKSIDDSIMQKRGVLSTYSRESFWGNLKKDSTDNILFDVEPGVYAPIAAYGTGKNSHKNFIILFPEKMIKSSIVNLKPNSMVYIGKFIFKKGPLLDRMKEADEIQKYYYSTINPKYQPDCVALSLEEIQQSQEIEKEFLIKYNAIFKDTDWTGKINNRLSEIK
jgi:hypothetical protein